jgi:hypothetical protein
VPTMNTGHGLRATRQDQPIDPRGATRYVQQKFGAALPDVRAAMEALARAFPPEQLAAKAYALYEQFRPAIPEGTRGWGAAGPAGPRRDSGARRITQVAHAWHPAVRDGTGERAPHPPSAAVARAEDALARTVLPLQ